MGQVAEWFKAHAWRACGRQPRLVGSNPTLSVYPAPEVKALFLFVARGVAQSGRALRSGRRGPRFKSGRPDWWFANASQVMVARV